MNVLIAAIHYNEIQTAYPFFIESIENLYPQPKKVIIFDLFEWRKRLEQKLLKDFIEIRPKKREKNFMEQLSKIRNEALEEARQKKFDAIYFTLIDLFPPLDMLKKLSDSKKEVIAPAFFVKEKNGFFSNAIKNTSSEKEKYELKPVLFEELIPSGTYPVFSVSLESVFLRKSAFDSLEFESVKNPVEEIFSFNRQMKKQNKEIFVDSSTVCAKHNLEQLKSYYYFKAQKLSEKKIHKL